MRQWLCVDFFQTLLTPGRDIYRHTKNNLVLYNEKVRVSGVSSYIMCVSLHTKSAKLILIVKDENAGNTFVFDKDEQRLFVRFSKHSQCLLSHE